MVEVVREVVVIVVVVDRGTLCYQSNSLVAEYAVEWSRGKVLW